MGGFINNNNRNVGTTQTATPFTTESSAIRSVSEEVENDDFEESFDVTENFDTDAELFDTIQPVVNVARADDVDELFDIADISPMTPADVEDTDAILVDPEMDYFD